MALIVAGEGRAENRGPMASPTDKNPENRPTESKSAGDAKPNEELADDDSIKDRPGDTGKNAKKKKTKTTKPGAAAPSGRGRSPRIISESTPVMSGGGGGFSSET
jgi:hypothetical protein